MKKHCKRNGLKILIWFYKNTFDTNISTNSFEIYYLTLIDNFAITIPMWLEEKKRNKKA